jgi:hypothetical protein
MNENITRLTRAKSILEKMAEGVNPINGERIEEGNFLCDQRMKHCLLFVTGVLDGELNRQLDIISKRLPDFIITKEQKESIVLPEGKISISEFVRCVNNAIDRTKSRKINAHELNSQLKEIGVLSEEKNDNGKSHIVINEKSKKYGIEAELRNSRDGSAYYAIAFNDAGKKFLLDNLEKILGYKK